MPSAVRVGGVLAPAAVFAATIVCCFSNASMPEAKLEEGRGAQDACILGRGNSGAMAPCALVSCILASCILAPCTLASCAFPFCAIDPPQVELLAQ